MGTSKGYGMPTGGDWTPLKTEATRFVKASGGNGGNDTATPERLLGRYLRIVRDYGNYASRVDGSGGKSKTGGKGGSGRLSRVATSTGQQLGGFLSGVNTSGLADTLREIGLSELIGKSASEVTSGLLDAFAAPASTLDEEAVRTALLELYDEMLAGADTFDKVEAAFSATLNEQGVVKTLANFFGKYLYRLICRDFYESWQKRVGAGQARLKLAEVKDYIFSALRSKFVGKETTKKDWSGKDGLRLSQQVMRNTLEIFEIA